MPAGAARSGTSQRTQASATRGVDNSAKISSTVAPSEAIAFTAHANPGVRPSREHLLAAAASPRLSLERWQSREETHMTGNPAGERPDLMGGPEPDEQGTDLMGGAESDEEGTDLMGGAEPDEEGTDLMGGAEPDEEGTDLMGGAEPDEE